jgi:hypothetical protein
MKSAFSRERYLPLSSFVPWLLLWGTPNSHAETYFRITTDSFSEPVSVASAFGDWGGAFKGGERQWTTNWVEVGYRNGNFGIGALARLDYDLRSDPDTAEIYYKVRNEQALQPSRRYTLNLNAKHFYAEGIRLSWQDTSMKGLSLSAGFSVFGTQRLVDGFLSGHATALNERDYSYAATVDYVYHKDYVFGRVVDTPSDGKGVALDLGLNYRTKDGHQAKLQVTDVISRLWWGEVPRTLANVRVAEFVYDENGLIVGKTESISGRDSLKSHTNSLSPRWHLATEYSINEHFNALFDYRYQYDQPLYAAGIAIHIGQHTMALRYWPDIAAMGLDYRFKRFQAALTANGLTPNRANTYWLNVSWN